jgi:hypothetical protein
MTDEMYCKLKDCELIRLRWHKQRPDWCPLVTGERKGEPMSDFAKDANVPANDCISRQAAIDMCRKPCMRNADCSDFEMEIMMLPSAQLDTYWKEQCQSYEKTINKLRESLSTQPEIIRCKGCKHRDNYGCCKHWKGLAMGDIPIATDDNDFCSNAER